MLEITVAMAVAFNVFGDVVHRFHRPVREPADVDAISAHSLHHDEGIDDRFKEVSQRIRNFMKQRKRV